MTPLAPARVGWCPGALRPMATGDGLLVRVKPHAGVLSLPTAVALADLASAHGNGLLELTARANLQIRGVTDDRLAPLQEQLDALHLIDGNAALEAVRNIVSAPVPHGGGRACVEAAVKALNAMLVDNPDLWRLPSKWSFVVDDGGPFSLRATATDLRFEAMPDGRFAIGLGDEFPIGACQPSRVAEIALFLCRAAINDGPLRMRELVQRRGAAVLAAEASLEPPGALPDRAATTAQNLVGCRGRGETGEIAVGLAPPFGTLQAEALSALARQAQDLGARDVRLTPWRVVLVTGLDPARADALIEATHPATWITRPDDPRLTIAACVGQPGCHRGSTAVQHDAMRVAVAPPSPGLPRGIAVHVSGCAKGCAHPQAAPVTLVGRDGLYDLVLDGKAGDKPVETGLSLMSALRRIEAHPT